MAAKLTTGKQLVYACGMMGMSIMINLISVLLIYVYAPPAGSGLPVLIKQGAILGVFNVIALIAVSGRFVDALYDPFIAQLSDKTKNPVGRRTPFMRAAFIPAVVFCCLVFVPLQRHQAGINIAWLALVLAAFYVCVTTYYIPYNALLPEMAPLPADKVSLSSWQSAGYVFGIAISANAFNLADFFQHRFGIASSLTALQITVATFAALACLLMGFTAFSIRERNYNTGKPHAVPIRQALKQTLGNSNFKLFIVADFAYFMAVTIIASGLVYFIEVLLGLPKTLGNVLMAVMVLASFVFYPLFNYLPRKTGKKPVIIVSLFLLAAVFGGVYFLGRPAINAKAQIFFLVLLASIPVASLNILPLALLAEIIEEDSQTTGVNKEALYFGVRYFFSKIAQTVGIGLFSMLLVFGKDRGNDLGVRLTGAAGFLMCVSAAVIFFRFREKSVAKLP